MQLITHRNHIDAELSVTIKDFKYRRYEQLVEDSGGEVIPMQGWSAVRTFLQHK